uniref:Prefoldin subunit 2 n=1 Tax=Timema shepardi TaxID=629360 RepID=A0A7R9ARE3_TIMSH|nr:unnamed protein product [Timema shepardi]
MATRSKALVVTSELALYPSDPLRWPRDQMRYSSSELDCQGRGDRGEGKKSKPKSNEEIFNGFQVLRAEQRHMANKLSEMEVELHEHKVVIETLKNVDGDRKCFRMVGGVLCEKTVKDVLPALITNNVQINKFIDNLNEQLTKKGQEVNEYKEKFNIKIRGQEDHALNAPNVESEHKTRTGNVLVANPMPTLLEARADLHASTVYHVMRDVKQWRLLDRIADDVPRRERERAQLSAASTGFRRWAPPMNRGEPQFQLGRAKMKDGIHPSAQWIPTVGDPLDRQATVVCMRGPGKDRSLEECFIQTQVSLRSWLISKEKEEGACPQHLIQLVLLAGEESSSVSSFSSSISSLSLERSVLEDLHFLVMLTMREKGRRTEPILPLLCRTARTSVTDDSDICFLG